MAAHAMRHCYVNASNCPGIVFRVGGSCSTHRPQPVPFSGGAAQRRGRAASLTLRRTAAVSTAAGAAAPVAACQEAVLAAAPYAVMGGTLACAAVALLLALAPGSRLAIGTSRALPRALVPLALLYAALLAASWQPDTLSLMMPGSLVDGFKGGFAPQFFPSLDSVSALFSRPTTQGSFLVHILAINAFLARTIHQEGQRTQLPTAHSVLLAAVCGPLGVLSHVLTQVLWVLTRRGPAPPKQLRSGGGTITIEPYE